ncbi:nadh-ubiquinone oxidoreductase kda subunit [Diplodia corticola]|uniref:Nadh-ubiquinone oxidoreductase kDa subunit n=1 Tax=Diplodia corticola TaxID=236234 RepID=A0A1J9QK22_9PEZI|nr:nadh-ubiquinone oxidoreductase kda subunit [Diplodia corticola]OJD29222.1 nadh-ubiquinone oxidoreductase kda subunit [Diplodia corticola]
MSQPVKSAAAKVAQAASFKKYTVQPEGIWARISNVLAVDPKRSTGVPLNPQFRNPPPGALDPASYDDPVTVPAGDIADNPYWKRDTRRSYPRLASVTQGDVVGLLSVGSAAAEKVELIGEAGKNKLVAVSEEGQKGVAAFFEKDPAAAKSVLNADGLPPLPSGHHTSGKLGEKKYKLEEEQSYAGACDEHRDLVQHVGFLQSREWIMRYVVKAGQRSHSVCSVGSGHIVSRFCLTGKELRLAGTRSKHASGSTSRRPRPLPPRCDCDPQGSAMALSQSVGQFPGALDVIFTCDICQASISDIYGEGGPGATVTDFQDGRPPTADRRVTCLWLTQCMHLTCGKHLEGGGAPFHPKGQHPKAPCPLCRRDKNDERPRTLYAVRGLRPGNFDPDIPHELFQVPPMKLQGQSVEREALQFQYLSLIRFATSISHRHNELQQEKREIESQAKKLASENAATTTENRELKAKLLSLEKDNTDIGKWRQRLPKITHYLKQWPMVMQEVNQLREQLADLGYAVPKKDYTFRDAVDDKYERTVDSNLPESTIREREVSTVRAPTNHTRTEYRTGRDQFLLSDHGNFVLTKHPGSKAQTHISESSSSRKRKLSELNASIASEYDQQWQDHHRKDRVPDTRVTIQGLLSGPTANLEKVQISRASNAFPSDPADIPEAQVFKDGEWHTNPNREARQRISHTPKPRVLPENCGKYLMTGGLAHSTDRLQNAMGNKTHSQEDQRHGILHAHGVGDTYEDETAFHVYDRQPETIRQPVFRRMHDRTTFANPSTSQVNQLPQNWPTIQKPDVGNEQLRELGLSTHAKKPERCQNINHGSATPLTRTHQASGMPSVRQNSSPFFSRVRGGARSGLSPGVAGLSANARVGTVSKRTNAPMPPPNKWSQPRGLNGLSFIDAPRDQSQSQPLYQASNMWPPQRNITDRPFMAHNPQRTRDGYFVRPEQPRLSSSYFGSVPQLQPAEPFQTPRMQSIPQYAPPISSRRNFTQNDALNLVENSSHQAPASFYQNQENGTGFSNIASRQVTEDRGLFSSAGGRRAVRR